MLTWRHVDVLVHVCLACQRKAQPVGVLVAVHEFVQVAFAEGVQVPRPLKHV